MKQMRAKLTQEEEQMKVAHVYALSRRAFSLDRPFKSGSEYTKYRLLEEQENWDNKVIAFEHPTFVYRRYLKDLYGGKFDPSDEDKSHAAHVKTRLRVRSEPRLYRQIQSTRELKPLTAQDLFRLRDLDFKIKICDMGNACYIDNPLSSVIQTREYRGPEVILDGEYDESADLWSLACMVFELVTGDYLFDPRKGKTYTKNDDHLALIEELIGPCKDLKWLKGLDRFKDFYKNDGKLHRISKLKPWRLSQVLQEKYRMKPLEAEFLAKFIDRMLKWKPSDRPTAQQMLDDPWLKMPDDWEPFISRRHLREYKKANNPNYSYSETTPSGDSEDSNSENSGESARSQNQQDGEEEETKD